MVLYWLKTSPAASFMPPLTHSLSVSESDWKAGDSSSECPSSESAAALADPESCHQKTAADRGSPPVDIGLPESFARLCRPRQQFQVLYQVKVTIDCLIHRCRKHGGNSLVPDPLMSQHPGC